MAMITIEAGVTGPFDTCVFCGRRRQLDNLVKYEKDGHTYEQRGCSDCTFYPTKKVAAWFEEKIRNAHT